MSFDNDETCEGAWEEIQEVITKYTGDTEAVTLEDYKEVLRYLQSEIDNLIKAADEDIRARDEG